MRLPTPSFTATFTETPYPFGGTTPKILKAIRLWAITFSDSARLRRVICEFSPIFQNTSFSEAFPYRPYTGKFSREVRH
jgi:sporulation-control protein spo0M